MPTGVAPPWRRHRCLPGVGALRQGSDARAGRPAYLYGLLVSGEKRKELVRSGWSAIRDLVAMGIMLDAVAQLLIYRQVHPGAALVVGPVLITLPYGMSRALTNRVARRMGGGPSK